MEETFTIVVHDANHENYEKIKNFLEQEKIPGDVWQGHGDLAELQYVAEIHPDGSNIFFFYPPGYPESGEEEEIDEMEFIGRIL